MEAALDSFDEIDCQIDPALAGCCAQDLLDQKKTARVLKMLRASDPSTQRIKQKQAMEDWVQGALVSVEHNHSGHCCDDKHNEDLDIGEKKIADTFESESESDDDSFEDDEFLSQFQETRLKDLEKKFEQLSQAKKLGFGIINEITFKEFQEIVEEGKLQKKVPMVLLVVSKTFTSVEKLLEEKLCEISEVNLGTKFFRAEADYNAQMNQYRVRETPAVVSFLSNGTFINTFSNFNTHDTSDVLGEKILDWLNNCHVLERNIPLSLETFQKNNDDTCNIDKEIDCGREGCRIRYSFYHEHVGADTEIREEIASWRR